MNSTVTKAGESFGGRVFRIWTQLFGQQKKLSRHEELALQEGFDAWNDNVFENPYHKDSKLHKAWEQGQEKALRWEAAIY